jgi:hypothetical protein
VDELKEPHIQQSADGHKAFIETVLTPTHSHPFEALLDEPFAATLDHPTAQWQAQFLISRIVNVLAILGHIGTYGR